MTMENLGSIMFHALYLSAILLVSVPKSHALEAGSMSTQKLTALGMYHVCRPGRGAKRSTGGAEEKKRTGHTGIERPVTLQTESAVSLIYLALFETVIEWKMARSSGGDEGDEVVRWLKLVELGPERGLREAGLSQESIDRVLSPVNRTQDKLRLDWGKAIEELSDIADGTALLLAFVGRGSKGITSLEIFGHGEMNSNEATALCVNMASNTRIAQLWIRSQKVFSDQKIMTLFANALKTNTTLINLGFMDVGMGSEAGRSLLDGLRANKNVSTLNLYHVTLLDEGVKFVVEVLRSNTSLKSLVLSGTGCGFEFAKLVSYALDHNTTLEQLTVGNDDIGRDGMKKLLEPLCHDTTISSDGPTNTTLRSLSLHQFNRESFCVDSVAWMIKVNKTLTSLDISRAPLDVEDWTGKIFPALQENKTLKSLDLWGCQGLDSEEVRSAFITLIKEGKIGLEEIFLSSRNKSWDAQVQEELRINKAYRDRLREQPMAPPTSRRIILCGREFAGKTTIRNTMERIVQGTSWYQAFSMAYKGVMRTFPHLRQIFFGTDACKELAERTRGFDILIVKEKPRTSLWDFAGQKAYYALHDYMFPNADNSYFLYVCSCRCPPTDSHPHGEIMTEKKMKDDFCYWLRFIASNSKAKQFEDNEGGELPHVQFVLTNIDTVGRKQRVYSKQSAKTVVSELRDQFKSVIELAENVQAVNGHNAADVQRLILDLTCPNLEKIVAKQRVYEICEEVQNALDTWSKRDSSKPVVSLEEFHNICREQRNLILDEQVEEGVLGYLNEMGDVIYLAGLDFIVVKPRWFGACILGYLVDAFEGQRRLWTTDCIFGHLKEPPCPPSDGILTRDHIEDLVACSLETMNVKETLGISGGRLVQLMVQLEMCFEEDPRNKNSRLFFPALFDEKVDKAGRGERKLEWAPEGGKPVYLGRRLQCEDESTTFLTPGFFPRLQVHLLLYMRKQNWTDNEGFDMGRNLIRFKENGHDICIEYSGNVGYFVDIMVRSSRPYADALKFVEEHVTKNIYRFCASPQGCQGVKLVEAVVRPACVQRLMVCVERKAHSVLVSTLRDDVKKGHGYMHTWGQKIPGVKPEDVSLHLLEGEPSRECSGSGISASREQKLPGFYLEPDPGFLTNLTKRITVAGLKPFKLHLYCNYEDGSEKEHVVQGQPGRTIALPWDSRYDFSKLGTALKFCWSKLVPGVKIDTFIDAVFVGGDIPTVDRRMLEGLRNTDETPVETLREYIHFTGRLKQILKDINEKTFWDDFRLQQIDDSSGKIGWYCEKHFLLAWSERQR